MWRGWLLMALSVGVLSLWGCYRGRRHAIVGGVRMSAQLFGIQLPPWGNLPNKEIFRSLYGLCSLTQLRLLLLKGSLVLQPWHCTLQTQSTCRPECFHAHQSGGRWTALTTPLIREYHPQAEYCSFHLFQGGNSASLAWLLIPALGRTAKLKLDKWSRHLANRPVESRR